MCVLKRYGEKKKHIHTNTGTFCSSNCCTTNLPVLPVAPATATLFTKDDKAGLVVVSSLSDDSA